MCYYETMKTTLSIVEQAFKLALQHNDISNARYFGEQLANMLNTKSSASKGVKNRAKHYVISMSKINIY